jgi:GNAT superfamily N-acetyltransferase
MLITAPIIDICAAATDADFRKVRTLFREYAYLLGAEMCVDDLEAEPNELPGRYRRPRGGLFFASHNAEVAGCVAFRPLTDAICEMKRLFVRPKSRGVGIGRQLAERVIAEASRIGYSCIRLDTLPSMVAAVRLYESLDFARHGNGECENGHSISMERHL